MLDFRGKKLPLGIRNNNPGNLRPGHDWQGMISENKGFVVFEDIHYGIRALTMDVLNKILRGLDTVQKIIDVYAPPVENDTKAYVAAVAKSMGVKRTDSLVPNRKRIKALVKAIIDHENGAEKVAQVISDDMIDTGMSMVSEKLKQYLK